MKTLFLLSLGLLASCSHPIHKPAPNRESMKPIEYCGGDLWGYIGPIAKNAKETAYMGVSYIGPKGRTFLFTYAMELPDAVDVEFEKNEFQITVNGKTMNQSPVEFSAQRIAFAPDHYYKRSEYTARVVDYEKNQWEVRKIHPIFGHMQLGEPKLIIFPKNYVEVVKNGKFHFRPNKHVEKTMLITIIPVWPLHSPLTDSEFNVKIPAMTIDQVKHPEQEFTFTFKLKDWEERAKSGKSRCPSLNELFWFNR